MIADLEFRFARTRETPWIDSPIATVPIDGAPLCKRVAQNILDEPHDSIAPDSSSRSRTR